MSSIGTRRRRITPRHSSKAGVGGKGTARSENSPYPRPSTSSSFEPRREARLFCGGRPRSWPGGERGASRRRARGAARILDPTPRIAGAPRYMVGRSIHGKRRRRNEIGAVPQPDSCSWTPLPTDELLTMGWSPLSQRRQAPVWTPTPTSCMIPPQPFSFITNTPSQLGPGGFSFMWWQRSIMMSEGLLSIASALLGCIGSSRALCWNNWSAPSQSCAW